MNAERHAVQQPEKQPSPISGVLRRAAVNEAPVNEVPPIVHEVLRLPGQPLDAETRAFFEPRFGHDFSQVRVHTDAKAAESARAIEARAYTFGPQIVFDMGEFAPTTGEGKDLIAHELGHVAHQALTPSAPVVQRKPAKSEKDKKLPTGSSELAYSEYDEPAVVVKPEARVKEVTLAIDTRSDRGVLYFALQAQHALTSFVLWYKHQPRADAAFAIDVINLLTRGAALVKEVGPANPAIGVIASIIVLCARRTASKIQTSKDHFADSLVGWANNWTSEFERILVGKAGSLLQQYDPQLFDEIYGRYFETREWETLLYEKALVPQPGVNYHVDLLSMLITKYRQWERSRKPMVKQMEEFAKDPYGVEFDERVEKETYAAAGLPIPER